MLSGQFVFGFMVGAALLDFVHRSGARGVTQWMMAITLGIGIAKIIEVVRERRRA